MQSTATKELQKVISDNRYTIALEHTGLPVATYVIRFCNNFIGQGQTVKVFNKRFYIPLCGVK